ncbi:MAG: hypothetical protein SF097_10570 [Acidobacteriota bacterium]|nr:hypothetical protein [Acidobacteriota bacterium]
MAHSARIPCHQEGCVSLELERQSWLAKASNAKSSVIELLANCYLHQEHSLETKALEAVVKFAGLGGVAILALWFV